MNRMRKLLLVSLTLGLLAIASVAVADALVHVKVRGGSADGLVTLTPKEGGAAHSCTTEDGECRIDGVPGGRYSVRFRPEDGDAPPPREAMIPPSGTVTLFVSAAAD